MGFPNLEAMTWDDNGRLPCTGHPDTAPFRWKHTRDCRSPTRGTGKAEPPGLEFPATRYVNCKPNFPKKGPRSDMDKSRPDSGKTRLWREVSGPVLTLGVAAIIEGLSRTAFKIPNPPAFLLLMVVFSAFRGGLRSGLISTALAWAYFAYYFSIPQQPFHYTDENLRRVFVWLLTTPAIALIVGMKRRHIIYHAHSSLPRAPV